jgi:hypothetical protein
VKSNFCLFELAFQKGDGLFGGFNLGLLDFKPFDGFKIHLPEFLIAFAEFYVFDFKIFQVSGQYFVIVSDSGSVGMILVDLLL